MLAQSKPLLILAGALACFHLGNGAMLPLFGMAAVATNQGDPAGFVAMTIVVAQGVMILASLVGMRMISKEGAWLVMLISFLALPIRGVLAAYLINAWGVYPVQALDGVGVGLQSVAVPTLVARILNGTGRINVGQGAVMTVQGVGFSISPAIGGWIAQEFGYSAAFVTLGSFALGSNCALVGVQEDTETRVRRRPATGAKPVRAQSSSLNALSPTKDRSCRQKHGGAANDPFHGYRSVPTRGPPCHPSRRRCSRSAGHRGQARLARRIEDWPPSTAWTRRQGAT